MNGEEKDEERDADLASKVAELPRAIAPARDLWTGVASRIEAKRRRALFVRRTVTTTAALLAAAAVLLVLRTARHPAPSTVTPEPIASLHAPRKYVRPTLDLLGAAVVPEETSYDAALAALAPTFDARLGALPERDADEVEQSLDSINEGIEATRAALEEDPSDADLRAELDGEYEQEIETMNDVLEWTTRS